MEKSVHYSPYYKYDKPIGKTKIPKGKSHICHCGESKKKPFCDESHAKCINGIVTPWFL